MRLTQLGGAAIVMLVLLRIAVGWHFFKEGAKKYNDPSFSSAAFLKAAKGPVAPLYHAMAGDTTHDWDRLMARPLKDAPQAAAQATPVAQEKTEEIFPADAPYRQWASQVVHNWQAWLRRHLDACQLDAEQQTQAGEIVDRRIAQLRDWLASESEALTTYRHEIHRLETWRGEPTASDVPFQQARIADKTSELAGQAAAWQAEVANYESELQAEILELLDEGQLRQAKKLEDSTPLARMDWFMPYFHLAIGILLIVGLFTRISALAAALFLLSVVVTQPPWVPGTVDVYYQTVELFATLVLATTHVGKWGGLDYFVHLLTQRCCPCRDGQCT